MPGTATNQVVTNIFKGPGKLWANLAIPAVGSDLVLHSDGTPESVANPNAIQVGLTKAGTTVTVKYSQIASEADELAAPYRRLIDVEEMAFEGEWLQLLDEVILKIMMPNATYSAPSGKKRFAVGGLSAIPSAARPSIALITPRYDDPTKFIVAHMFEGLNTAGLEALITRKQDASSKFKFEAQSIPSRAAGEQIGSYWWQTA
jgi:hypothetical protein